MSFKHGMTNTRLYKVWTNMKTRCYNKKNRDFSRWGARGVYVCEEWKNNFLAFYKWSMDNGYSDGLTIDRIDNDGPYCPDNCRWATPMEQANNTRKVRLIEWNGESHSLHEWARILNIGVCTLFYRLKRLGVRDAFLTPVQDPLLNLKNSKKCSKLCHEL